MKHLTDQQLNEYLDEALDASVRNNIETHLRACNECRARLTDFRLVFDHLAGLSETRLSHDLSREVMTRLRQKQPQQWTPAFAAQVGAALGALAWLSVQAARLIKLPPLAQLIGTALPNLPLFNFTLPQINPKLPALMFQFPALRFPSLHFQIPIFHYSISTINTVILAATVSALWLIGNSVLLRNRLKVRP